MSTFNVPVVVVPKVGKHPNADNLSIVTIFNTPVIFRTGDFHEGDLAVYVPYDAVVPLSDPLFSFLGKGNNNATTARIKPVRLRGIYSEGLLVKPKPGMIPGEDVQSSFGITKYEEPEQFSMATDNEKDPGFMPRYEVEPYLKYKHLLTDNEDVVVTEKIHGCNGRFGYVNGRLWVGSHSTIKRFNETNLWWKVAVKLNLEEKLKKFPGVIFYGEVYGQVQDLKYSVSPAEGVRLRIFDAYDTGVREDGTRQTGRWFDWSEIEQMTESAGLKTVPKLYEGPLVRATVEALRTGKSTLDNLTMREGIVIRPMKERYNTETGRTLLKLVSEEYKLRKNGTEHK